jgi:Kelch motif
MKKQINSTIKAHIVRSAFYMLLLLGVCVIPFALAQSRSRGTIRRSAANASGAQSINPSLLSYDIRPRPPVSPAGVCTPAPWQFAANMPIDLYASAGASDGTFFYAAGGYSFSQGNTLAMFNRYDPGTDSWTSLPDMPQAAIMAVAVYYPTTNKIYVFGGEDANPPNPNYNITRIYDIASGTWSTGANMPDVRSFMAGGYSPATGMIYILSGYNTGDVRSAQPNTWEYDPGTDTWTDLTETLPFPHPAGGFAYGVINGKLYIAGGRDANNLVINDNWEFDPTIPAYASKAPEPGTFENNIPGSGAASGVLWVFGGGNPFVGGSASKAVYQSTDGAFDVGKAAFPWPFVKGLKAPKRPATSNSGRFYDPVTDTWTNSPNMNVVRSFTSGGAIGDSLIIAAGGFDGGASVATAETEFLCGGGPTPTPTPIPTATPSCTPIVLNGVIDTSDPTQTDRLFRDGIPSTCAVPNLCPGVLGDGLPRHYDSYTFTNNTGATQCVNVGVNTACAGTTAIFTTAYLGSFDPSNLCTTYLADIGGSPNPTGSFSFTLDDGQTVVLVVNEVDPDAGCAAYTMTVDGLCVGGTPTPTATATPSVSPTATPRVTPRPRPTPHPRP